MAENKAKSTEAKTEKPEKKSEAKSGRQELKTDKKPKWTLQRCQKFARRFGNEEQWRSGHPSSYKSANHHGWVADCLAVQGQKTHQPLKKAA